MLKNLEECRVFFKGDVFALEVCGIRIDRADEDGADCSMAVTPALMNAGGVVQGGAIFTLCDFTFAVAANRVGGLAVTQSANVSFIRPGSGTRLTAQARPVSLGRQTCVYAVRVLDDRERLVAYATATGFRKAE